jgi:hypothetical protein
MKNNYLLLSLFYLPMMLISCKPQQPPIVTHRGEMVGQLSRNGLQQYDWFRTGYETYTPNQEALVSLRERAGEMAIEAYIGTWCRPSQTQLPQMIKIADEAGIQNITVIGVPMGGGILDARAIDRQINAVPTFIFLRGEREVGRITREFSGNLENRISRFYGRAAVPEIGEDGEEIREER